MNPFPELIEQIAAQFGTPPACVQTTPIRHGTLERNNVWRLEIGNRRYLLKQHLIKKQAIGASAFTPFQIESAVLSVLTRAGCCVPKIVWKSEPALCLLLEWGGETTLDALAQAQPIDTLKSVTINTIGELCRIEKAFAKHADAILPYVYPTSLHRTLQTVLDQARKTMTYLEHLSGTAGQANIDAIWTHLSDDLRSARPTLGRLDYNARNVVIDLPLFGSSEPLFGSSEKRQQKPTFIDFASVGWDWGERRLVQSLNSLGAHQQGGNFVSLLDRDMVEIYASEVAKHQKDCSKSEIAARVDYHHLLFYLVAIYRLTFAIAQPDTTENRSLLAAWGDAKARLRRALELLADSRLSDHPFALRMRELIGAFRRGLRLS